MGIFYKCGSPVLIRPFFTLRLIFVMINRHGERYIGLFTKAKKPGTCCSS